MCQQDRGWSGSAVVAMAIASRGGVAWKHENGLWVYLVDRDNRLVCDYVPRIAIKVYRPVLPLEPGRQRGYRWTSS